MVTMKIEEAMIKMHACMHTANGALGLGAFVCIAASAKLIKPHCEQNNKKLGFSGDIPTPCCNKLTKPS